MKGALLLALLVALPALGAPPAQACASLGLEAGVPCGKIYPTILVTAENAPNLFALKHGATLDVPLTVTYRFDALNDGYSVVSPADPVKVSFEFPRKPLWADMKVEPESFEVPVDDPVYFTPDPTASPPAMVFQYSQKVTVHVQLTGQAVLRDGFDYAKLLVFAKSTENGLFQAGYGIKELKTVPEGAVHQSDVAGQQDHFTASPLPPLDLKPVERAFAGTTVTVTPPKDAKFWESQPWSVKVSPAPAGRMVVAVHDEKGDLVAIDGPMDATGAATLNVTLAKPGLHTVSVTLLPAAGSATPPVTYALDVVAGDPIKAEGYQFGKVYVVDAPGAVPEPVGNTADATMQWERDVPFFAFDSAQAVSAILTLATPGAPDGVDRGLANIQFTLLDPDGNNVGQSSVDPSKPQWALRIGSVPQEGWYTLRLRGVGLPAAASYDARVEVDYSAPPSERNRADGVADATPATLARGGRNLTLPLANLTVWAPGDITPAMDHQSGARFALTVTDLDGAPQYASGLRGSKMSFTPPAPGVFRAFVYADPAMASAPMAPDVRVLTFTVGDGKPVVAQKFAIDDAPVAPTTLPTGESILALYAIPSGVAGGKAIASLGRADVVDAPGGKVLVVRASNPGPEATASLKYDAQTPAPVTLVPVVEGLVPAATVDHAKGVPGVGVAGLALAFALALVLRRR